MREAKTHLTELAREVEAGERILVTRNGKPVLELVAPRTVGGVNYEAGDAYLKSVGIERPIFELPDDFDAPLFEEFLDAPLTEPK